VNLTCPSFKGTLPRHILKLESSFESEREKPFIAQSRKARQEKLNPTSCYLILSCPLSLLLGVLARDGFAFDSGLRFTSFYLFFELFRYSHCKSIHREVVPHA
jgi:hypothetical protein